MQATSLSSDELRLLKGQGNYLADLRFDKGEAVTLKVVRSLYAHARIKRVVISEEIRSRALLILTGSDTAGLRSMPAVTQSENPNAVKMPVLAQSEVYFVGQPVACVVGADEYEAEDLAEGILVDYEPKEAVVDPLLSLEDDVILHENLGTNVCYREVLSGGGTEHHFQNAEVIVEGEFSTHRVSPNPIEPRGAVARWDGKRVTLWVSGQGVFNIRDGLSEVLSLSKSCVRVIQNDVGGAFGCKHALYPEYALLSLASMTLGRAVKWVETRSEHLQATGPGRDVQARLEVAARRDGEILAVRGRILADIGAFTFANNGNYAQFVAKQVTGPYRIRAAEIEALAVYTNKTPLGTYRGAGRPEASFLYERVVELVARKLGMDSCFVRAKNLIRPEDLPYTSPLGFCFESEDYPEMFSKAIEFFKYNRKNALVTESNRSTGGLRLGLGVSAYFELSRANAGETAMLRLKPNGRLELTIGIGPHGQSHRDVLRKLVSTEFGIGVERVDVNYGDSDLLPSGYGTFGSRSTVAGGLAALEACRGLKMVLMGAASESSGLSLEQLWIENGVVRTKEGSFVTDLSEISMKAHAGEIQSISSPRSKDVFSFGTHMAFVRLDTETGKVHLIEYKAIDDAGKVMDLASIEGQISGGVIQGLGEVLYEEVAYDGNGVPLASDLGSAGVPTAVESSFEFDSMVLEFPSGAPTGARGVGEAGAIGSVPALVAAIENALGVEVRDTLLKPENLFRSAEN